MGDVCSRQVPQKVVLTAASLRAHRAHAEVLAAGAINPGAQGAHVGAAGPAKVPGPHARQTDEEVAPTATDADPSVQPAHEKAPAVPTRKRPAGHTTGVAVGVIEGVAEVEGVMEGVTLSVGVCEGVGVGDGVDERDGVMLMVGDGVCEEDGVTDGVGLALMTHDGVTPPAHAQPLSAPLLVRTPPLPVAGAAHKNVYEVAPAVGAAGTTAVLAKAASGGCESNTTSEADSVRV